MKYEYRVSLSQLRTSLKYRSKEFLLENSLHSVPYIADPSLRKCERIVWFVLTVFSVSAAIWFMLMTWMKFQMKPTMGAVDTFTENIELDFPQIFLCFEWPQLNHSGLKEDERTLYEKVYNWRWGETIDLSSLDNNLQYKKHFRRNFYSLTPDCDAFYSNCTFSGEEEACSRILVKVITSVGACCKFNASRALTIRDFPWDFSFVPAIYPFKVYLMGKMDDGPQRDQKPLDVIYEPTTIQIMLRITYVTPGLEILPLSQRQCHYDEALTVNNCELRCASSHVFAKCGCVPWFLTGLGDYRECSLSEYPCANANQTETTDCDCLLPCDHTEYGCEKIETARKNTGGKNEICKIGTSNWPNVIVKRQIRFDYFDLVVSFGGIAGLFLSYSVFTSFEFVYYFSLKVYCSAVVEATRKKHNIIKVRATEAPSKLDVNPIYYNYVD